MTRPPCSVRNLLRPGRGSSSASCSSSLAFSSTSIPSSPSSSSSLTWPREGFRRFVLSLQYHGASFLGFSYQGEQENDSEGQLGSVEGRLRQALAQWSGRAGRNLDQAGSQLKGDTGADDDRWVGYEQLQVSSRTDRGVHALQNTCHVDLWLPDGIRRGRTRVPLSPEEETQQLRRSLCRGLNFHLRRTTPSSSSSSSRRKRSWWIDDHGLRRDPLNELRILNARPAPDFMLGTWAGPLRDHPDDHPPSEMRIPWHARHSATERTYIYRLLVVPDTCPDWAAPFEWDRSWRIALPRSSSSFSCSRSFLSSSTSTTTRPAAMGLDVTAMRQAAQYLVGRHDFSSFRGTGCQRASPVVELRQVAIQAQPYDMMMMMMMRPPPRSAAEGNRSALADDEENAWWKMANPELDVDRVQMVTILFRGEAFVYRQVRNLVGCLVQVGLGRRTPAQVRDLLQARDRNLAPGMAPAHGLYLAQVRHGDFVI